MPIYEYECKACGHVFDVLQKMSDSPLTDCPDCNEPALKKLLEANGPTGGCKILTCTLVADSSLISSAFKLTGWLS